MVLCKEQKTAQTVSKIPLSTYKHISTACKRCKNKGYMQEHKKLTPECYDHNFDVIKHMKHAVLLWWIVN